MGDEFDFYNSFLGVEVGKTEAVSDVIGRVIAKLRSGMVSAGMTDEQADTTIGNAIAIMMNSLFSPPQIKNRSTTELHKWAKLLVERDPVEGPKVLQRMVEYYAEEDGRAHDFGRLRIVIDAQAALGND